MRCARSFGLGTAGWQPQTRFMTTDSLQFLVNEKNPNFTFLEIDQEMQVREICARWPLLGALCIGRCVGLGGETGLCACRGTAESG
jgi:hypothetical protein